MGTFTINELGTEDLLLGTDGGENQTRSDGAGGTATVAITGISADSIPYTTAGGDSVKDKLDVKLESSSVLVKTNTDAYTPTANYHPATKKYVDDSAGDPYSDAEIKTKYENNADTNAYSDTEKAKLAGIAASANNYSLPTATDAVLGGVKIGSGLSIASGVVSADSQTDNNYTDAEKAKLLLIESGAEVNNISDADATELTDGSETGLHTHAGVHINLSTENFDGHLSPSDNTLQKAMDTIDGMTLEGLSVPGTTTETAIATWKDSSGGGFYNTSVIIDSTSHMSGHTAFMDTLVSENVIGSPTEIDNFEKIYNHLYSAAVMGGCAITDNGDGTVSFASGYAAIRESATSTATLHHVELGAQTNLALIDNSTNYIYLDYNAGSPEFKTSASTSAYNCQDKCLTYIAVRVGTDINYIDIREQNVDSRTKNRKLFGDFSSFIHTQGGTALSEPAALALGVTAGSFYKMITKLEHPAFDTSAAGTANENIFSLFYRDGVGGWTETIESKLINTTTYDNNSGTPAVLSNNKYGVSWVYICNNTPSSLCVVMGQLQYSSQSEAELASPPASLPYTIAGLGVLIGFVVYKKSTTVFTNILSAYKSTFSASLATEHNGLAGLQGGDIDEYYHTTAAQNAFLDSTALTTTASLYNTAINELNLLKAPIESPAFTGTPTGITSTHVGLGNVDNTSDVNKPVSTAQQTALDLKANLVSPQFTGTPDATEGMKISGVQASPYSFKNILINGDMRISQRGDYTTQSSAATGVYYIDRWASYVSDVTADKEHLTTSDGAVQPSGKHGFSLKYVATSSTSGMMGSFQKVEEYAIFRSKTVVLTVWVKSNHSGARLIFSDGVSYSYSSAHTGGGSWEKLTIAKTLSTSATSCIVYVVIASSSFTSTSITSGDYIEFTQAQLEVGSVATSFEERPIGLELSLCQRYYFKITAQKVMSSVSSDDTVKGISFSFPVTMRTVPSETYTFLQGSINLANPTIEGTSLRVTGSTGGAISNFLTAYTAGAEL